MSLRKLFRSQQTPEEHIQHPELKFDVEHGHDESNWLVSYADMMTLLCGFFVMMFSMANLDKEKFDKFREEVSEHFQGQYEKPGEQLRENITKIIRELGIQELAKVTTDINGIQVSFQSVLFFDTLSAEIQPAGLDAVNAIIDAVKESQRTENKLYRIAIEGHSDSRPVTGGLYPSNWELSAARAARVVRVFIDRGFDYKKLIALGYADTKPEFEGRRPSGEWDEVALAKNRRVVIRVLDPETRSIPTAN